MENTQENLSDSEQINHPSPTDHDNIAENRRYTFIQRQLTPLLAAISMIELPSSEEDENENSETEMNRTKGATTCSETNQQTNTTESNQSLDELTSQDRDYFNQLEKETKEKEKESATWGKKGQDYKFHCITSNLDQLAYTSDISNAGACVEALFRSQCIWP